MTYTSVERALFTRSFLRCLKRKEADIIAQFTTDAGLLRTLALLGTDITHVGVQSGVAPTTTSTLLNTELDRVNVVDPLVDGYTLVVDGFFDTTEANGTITGYGVFGNGATDTLDTGELFAATDAAITKTSADSLTVSAEITVRRVIT